MPAITSLLILQRRNEKTTQRAKDNGLRIEPFEFKECQKARQVAADPVCGVKVKGTALVDLNLYLHWGEPHQALQRRIQMQNSRKLS